MSIDGDCYSNKALSVGTGSCHVVAGTSQGRLVAFRRNSHAGGQLVPTWVMQKRDLGVLQGSLHSMPGGVVIALRHDNGSIEASHASTGIPIGSWRLPSEAAWTALCGSETHIYLLGRKLSNKGQLLAGAEAVLWRFALPEELTMQHLQDTPTVVANRFLRGGNTMQEM